MLTTCTTAVSRDGRKWTYEYISCWGYMDRLRHIRKHSQIAKFMGPTWDPPGSCRPQMGPMLVPWTLLSGLLAYKSCRTMPRCVLSQYPLCMISLPWHDINTLRPRWNGRHFTNDIFKCIFLTENSWFSLKISLKFVPKFRIYNIPAMVQIMAWCRPGDKPLSEPMVVRLLTHTCVNRLQQSQGIAYNNLLEVSDESCWMITEKKVIKPTQNDILT